MQPENKNLLYAIAFFLGCFGVIQFCEQNSPWQITGFIALLFIALPVLLLRLFEAANVWRQSNGLAGRFFGWLLGGFHLLFALSSLGIGVAIILWILYNLLIKRQPEFTGFKGSFGVAPLLIGVGWLWLRGIFAKRLPELSEWFFIEFDQSTVFVRAHPPHQDAWQYQFSWANVCRVCFKDGGLSQSDGLYVWITGQEESFVLPTEASGDSAFFLELNQRGLFPDDLMKQAAGATDGGWYCHPGLEEKK